ncbi:NifB/NifX family molybdenum-iron cluster-binding protein [Aeromonas diversa]|uniref:NifB/NifX family molybdenum-iron cluster-binding protein n=1 Tax=Aeromonas diversa TaxID=502790 RepID=UPI0034638040
MLIAIPVDADRFIAHVARAPGFLLQDASGHRMGHLDAPGGGCQGPLPTALCQRGVTQLMVRRIGEHMLARLNAAGIDVVYAERGWQPGHPVPSATAAARGMSRGRSDSDKGAEPMRNGHTRQPFTMTHIRGKS